MQPFPANGKAGMSIFYLETTTHEFFNHKTESTNAKPYSLD
jgi:hypothetical protein